MIFSQRSMVSADVGCSWSIFYLQRTGTSVTTAREPATPARSMSASRLAKQDEAGLRSKD